MAKIKTRDAVKGTIKTIDKAAVAGERMKAAYIATKERAEHSTHAVENSAEEYAADRYESGVDHVVHEGIHQFDKQGRKGFETTKENVIKAKLNLQLVTGWHFVPLAQFRVSKIFDAPLTAIFLKHS